MKNVNIFLDTNVIEVQNKKLFEFRFNGIYYRLKKFIEYNNYNNFNIIIPQVVLDEINRHYIEEYEEIENKLERLDEQYKGIKSDLIKIGYDMNIIRKTYNSIDEYKNYLKLKFDNYMLEEEKFFEVIPYPNRDRFYSIIERAIEKKRPFFSGKDNKKEFSDAGFKDVVILESIKEKMEKENADYIVVTNDNIVNGLTWNEEITDRKGRSTNAKNDTDIIEFICNEYELKDLSEYIEFSKSEYFMEKINKALENLIVEIVEVQLQEYDDENIVEIKCKLKNQSFVKVILNETKEFICITDESDEIIYQW